MILRLYLIHSFLIFFSEELRLQRNIDNYSLLRPSSNKSSSKGNSPKDAGKSQSSKDGDATFIDRTEFLITKVSIFFLLVCSGVWAEIVQKSPGYPHKIEGQKLEIAPLPKRMLQLMLFSLTKRNF